MPILQLTILQYCNITTSNLSHFRLLYFPTWNGNIAISHFDLLHITPSTPCSQYCNQKSLLPSGTLNLPTWIDFLLVICNWHSPSPKRREHGNYMHVIETIAWRGNSVTYLFHFLSSPRVSQLELASSQSLQSGTPLLTIFTEVIGVVDGGDEWHFDCWWWCWVSIWHCWWWWWEWEVIWKCLHSQ